MQHTSTFSPLIAAPVALTTTGPLKSRSPVPAASSFCPAMVSA
jgi:hypothetical protein